MKFVTIFLLLISVTISLSQVVTRGGRYAANYTSTDPFRASRDNERSKTVRINFAAPFATSPKIGLALYSFSVNYGEAGVSLEVDQIALDHFTFKIIAPAGAAVNSVGVSWLATNSARINIGYVTATNPEASDVGQYTIGGTVNFPELTGSVNALPFIAGFQFPEFSDIRMQAEVNALGPDTVGLDIWVEGDNVPNYINVLVLHFRNDFAGGLSFSSTEDGILFNGSGERHQFINRFLTPQKNYFVFSAVSGFHFQGRLGYRVRQLPIQANVGTQRRIRYDLETWGNSKVHQTDGNLLYI